VSAAPPVTVPPEAVTPAGSVPATAAPPRACENCGTAVTERYCGTCGQRREPPVHSLWHFTQVAAEDLTHADSRLWRTLGALLMRPGFLTREFLAGRRARYLPPVRLYLVLSLLFFVFASTVHGPLRMVEIDTSRPTARVTPLDSDSGVLKRQPGESDEQRAERICSSGENYDGPWKQQLAPLAHRACLHFVADNGRSLREAFFHNVPRAMFLFLPLLAGTMMLMYWHPRHYYVEHLLLFVHNHAFVFLLLLLVGVVSALLPSLAKGPSDAATLYILWYVYRSMRVVYGQGRLRTFAKFAALSVFYLVCGSLMLALTSVYSVLTL
jgi:hypothetical protein